MKTDVKPIRTNCIPREWTRKQCPGFSKVKRRKFNKLGSWYVLKTGAKGKIQTQRKESKETSRERGKIHFRYGIWDTLMKMRPWVIASRFTACELLLIELVAKDESLLLSSRCCCCRIFTSRKNMFHLDSQTKALLASLFSFFWTGSYAFCYSTCRLGEKKNCWRFGKWESW